MHLKEISIIQHDESRLGDVTIQFFKILVHVCENRRGAHGCHFDAS